MEKLNLTDGEKEILILKAVWESIGSMVNYAMFDLSHNDPDSSILFKTRVHQQYFNIILLDFLQSKVFEIDKSCIESLQGICNRPQFNRRFAHFPSNLLKSLPTVRPFPL